LKVVFTFLDSVPLATDVRVTSVELEPRFVQWLAAIGLEEGSTVRILRRAILGGPLHVRTTAGAELAIHRSLARAIRVEPVAATGGVAADSRGPSVRRATPASEPELELAPVSQSTA